MLIHRTTTLTDNQLAQINQLWNEEYPTNLYGRLSILLNETENHRHFYINNQDGKIIAWCVLFINEEQDRFSIIVSSKTQGLGLGKRLLDAMKAEVTTFSGWVIDHENDVLQSGEKYRSPIDFYLKNGFEVIHDERLETSIISCVKVTWNKQTGP
jgi:predicted GNAT family N-acyltransferase